MFAALSMALISALLSVGACVAPPRPTYSEAGATLPPRHCLAHARTALGPARLAQSCREQAAAAALAGGIGFAVLLMLMQLGFEQAFFESALAVIRGLDGDLSDAERPNISFATRDPFPAADLDKARNVPGVASARRFTPTGSIFLEEPVDGKIFLVRAFGFDPDAPVFLFADVNADARQVEGANTVLVDRRARRFLGMDSGATKPSSTGPRSRSSAALLSAPISRATARS